MTNSLLAPHRLIVGLFAGLARISIRHPRLAILAAVALVDYVMTGGAGKN